MSSIEENTVHPWVTWLLFYFEKILILCALKVFGLLTFWLLSESPLCQWQSYLREDVDVVRDLSSERDAVTVLVNKWAETIFASRLRECEVSTKQNG